MGGERGREQWIILATAASRVAKNKVDVTLESKKVELSTLLRRTHNCSIFLVLFLGKKMKIEISFM